MTHAFKEWAVVVDALLTGRQIVILRKGGIEEGRGGFRMEHDKFILFPTLFHQQRESVIPEAQAQFDEIIHKYSVPETIIIEGFAEVVHAVELKSLADAEALRGQHIWRDEVIAKRFDAGGSRTIHAIAVRVFRLPRPVEFANQESYAGCKSWVELVNAVDTSMAKPVLNDSEFATKLKAFETAISKA